MLFETVLYRFTSSGFDSEIIALSGSNAKNKAPPPKKASMYLLYLFGVLDKSTGSNCCFPPAHFKTGRGGDSKLVFVGGFILTARFNF
nr:hypothetical protein [Desulfonema limicola]